VSCKNSQELTYVGTWWDSLILSASRSLRMGFSNLEILQQCENMLPFFVVALFATAAAEQ
jgi:hypothetical protein